MKKLYILLLVTLFSYTGYCQNVYAIEADSIKLSSESSNSELIIENSTRNIPGFLYNTGNGRTEFREILNGNQNGDSAAYHSIEQGTDSTYFTISNLNGGIDTVQFVYDSSTIDIGGGVTQAQLDDSTAAIRGAMPVYTACNGLTLVNNNEQLGGQFDTSVIILGSSAHYLKISDDVNSGVQSGILRIANSDVALSAQSSTGNAILTASFGSGSGLSTNNFGSGSALHMQSQSGPVF